MSIVAFVGGPLHRQCIEVASAPAVLVRPTESAPDGGHYVRVSRETAGLTQMALVTFASGLAEGDSLDIDTVMVWGGAVR